MRTINVQVTGYSHQSERLIETCFQELDSVTLYVLFLIPNSILFPALFRRSHATKTENAK